MKLYNKLTKNIVKGQEVRDEKTGHKTEPWCTPEEKDQGLDGFSPIEKYNQPMEEGGVDAERVFMCLCSFMVF